MPKLLYLSFFEFFYLLVLLLSPLILACFLYSMRRVEFGPTMIVFARLKLKSCALILMLLLSLKGLSKACYLVVEERVLDRDMME